MARYRFNGRVLNTATRQVEGPDGAVHLPPKPYEVLVELLEKPGQLVTREALLEHVWPERPASDETLSRTVADLRKYLGDHPRTPRYIETIPKVGYRFVARVEMDDGRQRRNAVRIAAAAAGLAAVAAVFLLREPTPDNGQGVSGGILQQPVPVTTEVGDEDAPDFSPDGRWLIYAGRNPGDDNWNIRLRNVASGETRDIVSHPDREYGPSFAPDGERIAFRRYRGEHCELIVKALDGPERVLTQCRTPMMAYTDWSPDGLEIAYSDAGDDGTLMILKTIDVESGRVRRLFPPGDPPRHEFAPEYSPDGSKLVYLRGDFERNELWIADLERGSRRALTDMGGWISGAAWNGDGSALMFTTDRPEQALWRLPLEGEPVRIRRMSGAMPAYDPVHRRLVYDNVQMRTNIWSLERLAGGAWSPPRSRISSTREDYNPSVSPDGSRVAFTSDRTGDWEVWITGVDEQAPRKLTNWQAEAIDRPDWSPDGQALVYSVLLEGRWAAYIQRTDGSAPRPLPTNALESRHPRWSPDGRHVYHAAADGIRRLNLDDGHSELQVPLPGAVPLFIRGDVLHFLRPGRPGIHQAGSGETEQARLADFDLVIPAAVSHAAGRIFFVATSPRDGLRRIHEFDLASGVLKPVLPVISNTRQAHVSASADGRVLYFSQTDDAHSDLELLEDVP